MTYQFASVERSNGRLPGNFGELVEIEPPAPFAQNQGSPTIRVRVEDAPQDTVATSPDAAATMAAAMLDLCSGSNGQLGFKVEFFA